MENVTIVSALLYIGRDKWKQSGFGLGHDRYKNWVRNILSLDTKLILFTDEYYYDYVLDIKKQYDPNLEKLTIIKTSIEDMETYQKYYNRVSCLMKSPEFFNEVRRTTAAEMLYPLYNILMFNKVNFLQIASKLNPYSSTHLFWADAGAFRNELSEYENVKWPNNESFFNDKITFFSHLGTDYTISNQKNYFMSQARVVHGGYFIVPLNQIDFLKNEVDNVIEEILTSKYIGSDEKIFDLICKRFPNYVDMIKSGWFEFYKMTM